MSRDEQAEPDPALSSWRGGVRDDVHQGKAAARLGWALVRRRPGLILTRALGAACGWAVIASAAMLALVMGSALTQSAESAYGALDALRQVIGQERFWIGAGGAWASLTAVAWSASALSRAVVWGACHGALDAREEEEPLGGEARGARAGALRFWPEALLWEIFAWVFKIAATTLAVGVYLGLIATQTMPFSGGFKAFILASLYASGLIYAPLCVATVQLYPAMTIAHSDESAGERLVRAAGRALEHPVALYRLALYAFAPAGALYAASLGCALIAALASPGGWVQATLAAIEPVTALTASLCGLAGGVVFRAGSTLLEGAWCGEHESPAARLALRRARSQRARLPKGALGRLGRLDVKRPGEIALNVEDLRPAQMPHRVALSEALALSAPSEERAVELKAPSRSEEGA